MLINDGDPPSTEEVESGEDELDEDEDVEEEREELEDEEDEDEVKVLALCPSLSWFCIIKSAISTNRFITKRALRKSCLMRGLKDF